MPSQPSDDSSQPLLSSDTIVDGAELGVEPHPDNPEEVQHNKARGFRTQYTHSRRWTQGFLNSRTQHFCILGLVTLDLLGIGADIFINLYTCEEDDTSPVWDDVRNGLGIAGLVFSCLFMVELILSVWAFGWRYFTSYFHTFDAIVIMAGFVVDVLLHGVLEEVASLVVILRLWRFFKIIEEFSVGAQEQMDGLELRIESLESENKDLKERLRKSKGGDEESEVGMQEQS